RISSLSLALLIVLLLVTNIQNVIALFGTRGILASILFLFGGVGIGWLLGGPGAGTKGVLALATAQRNIAAALVVGGKDFDDPKVLVMIPVKAQVRGVYPVGMNATNSGVTPEAGITYSNLFVFFSRDEEKGPHGEILATGQNSILMDMNSFVWVSKKEMNLLGGAVFSASATLPIANNSLTSDIRGAISGGGGFADSYYQPFILGWRKQRVAIRAIYGFLAPTGRFSA